MGAKVKVEPSLKKSEKYFCGVLFSGIAFWIESHDQVDSSSVLSTFHLNLTSSFEQGQTCR